MIDKLITLLKEAEQVCGISGQPAIELTIKMSREQVQKLITELTNPKLS